MSICRDWTTSRWPACSCESAGETGGRQLRADESCGRDDPHLGDLSASSRIFKSSACVTGNADDPHARAPAFSGQAVFDTADRMAVALSSRFPGALQLTNGTDFMVAAAVDMVETVAASIEFVRTATIVDSKISAQVRTASDAIMTAAPLLITPGGVAATDVDNLLAAAPPLTVIVRIPTRPRCSQR